MKRNREDAFANAKQSVQLLHVGADALSLVMMYLPSTEDVQSLSQACTVLSNISYTACVRRFWHTWFLQQLPGALAHQVQRYVPLKRLPYSRMQGHLRRGGCEFCGHISTNAGLSYSSPLLRLPLPMLICDACCESQLMPLHRLNSLQLLPAIQSAVDALPHIRHQQTLRIMPRPLGNWLAKADTLLGVLSARGFTDLEDARVRVAAMRSHLTSTYGPIFLSRYFSIELTNLTQQAQRYLFNSFNISRGVNAALHVHDFTQEAPPVVDISLVFDELGESLRQTVREAKYRKLVAALVPQVARVVIERTLPYEEFDPLLHDVDFVMQRHKLLSASQKAFLQRQLKMPKPLRWLRKVNMYWQEDAATMRAVWTGLLVRRTQIVLGEAAGEAVRTLMADGSTATWQQATAGMRAATYREFMTNFNVDVVIPQGLHQLAHLVSDDLLALYPHSGAATRLHVASALLHTLGNFPMRYFVLDRAGKRDAAEAIMYRLQKRFRPEGSAWQFMDNFDLALGSR